MHADRFRYSAANCSIARTLGVVGEKWTLLILREAFYGVRRFDDFPTALGCARNLLAARLKTLVAHELLERVAYQDDGGRGRHEYRLTEKGRDLFPTVVALMQWGDKWLAGPAGPPALVIHRDCGRTTSGVVVCSECHAPLTADNVHWQHGPGAHRGPGTMLIGDHLDPPSSGT